jgi:transglutaminase-like putative cysteine protease
MSFEPYLRSSEFIDHQHPLITAQAHELAQGCVTDLDITQRCFEFVRDAIKHSGDFMLNPLTVRASDVLLHGTGFCYAKSHLLAALLRAKGIPTGLCYQRLSVSGDGAPFCLHGLNAVHLSGHGWYRVDARGNKPGVSAQFTPPVEQLAFATLLPQECDFPEIWPEPLPVVVNALTLNTSVEAFFQRYPDIEILPTHRKPAGH